MLRSKSIHFTEIWNLTLIFNGIEARACVGYCGGWKRALGLHYKEFCFKYCWGSLSQQFLSYSNVCEQGWSFLKCSSSETEQKFKWSKACTPILDWLAVTSTLAYSATIWIAAVVSFVVQAPNSVAHLSKKASSAYKSNESPPPPHETRWPAAQRTKRSGNVSLASPR